MTESDQILVENYLRGFLSEKEKELFFQRLDTDAEFKAQFKLEAELFNALDNNSWSFINKDAEGVQAYKTLAESEDIETLKSTLVHVNADLDTSSQNRSKTFYYYLVAASLIVFFAVQFFINQNNSHQKMYNDYASLDDLPSFVTRSNADSLELDLMKGEQFFDDKNFDDALAVFEPILHSNKTNELLYVYVGLAQAELKLYDKAKATYDNLINTQLYTSDIGYWYKALLYLKQDRVEDSKAILKSIVAKKFYNHKKAEALLSELDDE